MSNRVRVLITNGTHKGKEANAIKVECDHVIGEYDYMLTDDNGDIIWNDQYLWFGSNKIKEL